jgi:Concanavalin A-like lectin/glucanases superfamily
MKKLFSVLALFFIWTISFSQGSGGGNLNPYIPGRPGATPLTTYANSTPAQSDTITFNPPAVYMKYTQTRNTRFTTVPANNTINAGQVWVAFHPDGTHSVTIDTTLATGFKVIGWPDSLHDCKLFFQYDSSHQQPLCTVGTYGSTASFTQAIYSDSINTSGNQVATLNNANGDLSFLGNSPFTIGVWVKKQTDGIFHYFFVRKDGSNIPINASINSSNQPELKIQDSLGNFIDAIAADLPVTVSSAWTHIVYTYSGNKLTSGLGIWVNNVQSAATLSSSGTLQNSDTQTGTNTVSFATNSAMKIGPLFFCNIKLTPTQIAEAYNSNNYLDMRNASFYANEVALYEFLNQTFVDLTGNGHAATITTPLYSTDHK